LIKPPVRFFKEMSVSHIKTYGALSQPLKAKQRMPSSRGVNKPPRQLL
jgi:hypothetical protein